MRGKHRVIVQNNKLHYEFDIKRNITIIKGDSATGKTTLIDMIRLAQNHKSFLLMKKTRLSIQKTLGTYLLYSKTKLADPYLHEGNRRAILTVLGEGNIILEK